MMLLLLHSQVVFVLQANDSGHIVTPLPGSSSNSSSSSSQEQGGVPELQRPIDWLLVDGMQVRGVVVGGVQPRRTRCRCLSRDAHAALSTTQGGSGKAFDWTSLDVPTALARRGWLLAGGLHPGNVAQAVSIARPTAVDVSSGVCGPDGLLKDAAKVAAFVAAAKQQ
jgi:hypothetical protein